MYEPNPWMMLPFVALLATIALGPLFFGGWWLRHYAKVSFGLAAITLAYYLLGLPPKAAETVLHAAEHYVSFIALIGSLYVVSGGIHIKVKGEATPVKNVAFLLTGAILANLLGTTGASMLLIRPWLRANKYRLTAFHVIFFIFIVSNVGGCLTPIGDPPLFLGYLLGVPFWWVAEHCWLIWAVGVGTLLVAFYVLDRLNFNRAPEEVRTRETVREEWRLAGLPNVFFLALILGAVFIEQPRFLREGLMVAAGVASYLTTRRAVHQANDFSFHPIQEVAILFIGIFATMIPALDWLQLNAGRWGQPTATSLYWGTGGLSSVLDNAPTYLSFLSTLFGQIDKDVLDQVERWISAGGATVGTALGVSANEPVANTIAALQKYYAADLARQAVTQAEIKIAYLIGNPGQNNHLVAVSVGAVFFGACTYIGNGPNFMVKAIAEQQKARTPTFLGYVFKYALPYLGPMLLLVWLLFFRH